MILDRIQRYLGMAFLTSLIITQATVFVAVKASNDDDLLRAVFVEPVSENINIGDSLYFQAMLSNQDDSQFDLVYFNLKNLNTGLDENYQASLQGDGTWVAQNAWDTSVSYQPGEYYLSVVAHDNSENQLNNIYYSQAQVINLVGELKIAAGVFSSHFTYPEQDQEINRNTQNSIEAILYMPNDIETDRSNLQLRFLLTGTAEDEEGQVVYLEFLFPEDAKLDSLSLDGGYLVWKSTIALNSNMLEGIYSIRANSYNDGEQSWETEELNFSIVADNSIAMPIPAEELMEAVNFNVTSPTRKESFTMTDEMLIEVFVDQELDASQYYITVDIVPSSEALSVNTVELMKDNLVDLRYSTKIDLDGEDWEENEGSEMSLGGVYGISDYFISFTLNSRSSFVPKDKINISIVSEIEEEEELDYEIILNNQDSLFGGAEGDLLELNFETNFSASRFNFSVVKEGNSSMGISEFIDLVGDGTSWAYTLSAEENNFTNGIYILTASAWIEDQTQAEYSPAAFEWQITAEDIPVEPSLAIHVADTNLSSGDILIGSGNILGSEFILQNTTNEEEFYSFMPSLVECANSSMISQSIRESALVLGHNHCFYYVLGLGEETIDNGNYYLFLQRESASEPVVVSVRELVTYFDEDNLIPEDEEDIIFNLYEPQMRVLDNLLTLSFPRLSSLDTFDFTFGIYDLNGYRQDTISPHTEPVTWDNLDTFGIYEVDHPRVILKEVMNIPLQDSDGNMSLEDGDYYLEYTVNNYLLLTDKVYFSILNSELAVYQEPEDEQIVEEEGDQPEDEQIVEDLIIDFYSTCYEEGISDKEACIWFRATMDLLDETCIEQGIYEALACEDYLYRMETDLECQENNIIDREQCKDYLLEKYGGQVDCQLEDMNLCNSILRNEYLSRLVSAQRQSQNINQAVDSLLGQNISTQELSDNLKNQGVDSQEVLPLVPDQNTRVLISKAQKEIVLEEKDRLTILNQAVIILDTDGDGLSDDLEAYYGTEINNSDTDGDGYSDGEEIKNGYDPVGPGKLIKKRTNFDIVILDDEKIIEQPKVKSKKIDKKMEVAKVDVTDGQLKLSGKAEANTWVNLYLYSGLPLVMTTKTDASGNWSYSIKNSVTDGHHRVFVTVNDDTGKIVKQSRPISFLIKEARAVTADDYFDETSSNGATNNLFIYYILGGAFLVFLALGVIVFLHKGKNQDLEV